MKPILAFLIPALLLSLPCFAQRSTPVGVGGFGNVLHPGTGGPSNFTRAPGQAYGNPGGRRAGTGNYGARYAVGYPLYVGGGYVPAYGSGYAPDYSGQTQLNPQQQAAPAPPVVINQYFAPPVAPEPVTGMYQDRPAPMDDSASTPSSQMYLLAFKDHSVYSALAYWIEDKTLHYVTPRNTHNQASLDLVDVEFTKQLNRDREVPFSLETPSK